MRQGIFCLALCKTSSTEIYSSSPRQFCLWCPSTLPLTASEGPNAGGWIAVLVVIGTNAKPGDFLITVLISVVLKCCLHNQIFPSGFWAKKFVCIIFTRPPMSIWKEDRLTCLSLSCKSTCANNLNSDIMRIFQPQIALHRGEGQHLFG
jgi:hypothetical protein